MEMTFRGLPLKYSCGAQLATSRYGMAMLGLEEDDFAPNRTYPGMTDDVAIVVFVSLCEADAGKHPDCPAPMRGVLRHKTLTRSRGQLAELVLQFFDAFQIGITDPEVYEVGFGLMGAVWDSQAEVVEDGDSAPGKPGGVGL